MTKLELLGTLNLQVLNPSFRMLPSQRGGRQITSKGRKAAGHKEKKEGLSESPPTYTYSGEDG